ncbi:hypothetical protein CTEN210_05417 [Chaetoceros tenuissimus]|uniref:Uncharacterized protein n=1 Tax=Chaetoceros tenuissimus TaxID=426638 RepID=A0AAD3CN01_9STRA|nr:hypothetical protein CTEN210_05417 [Chaetoceros tenuissimus]
MTAKGVKSPKEPSNHELFIPKEQPFISLLTKLNETIIPGKNDTSPLLHCPPTAQVKISISNSTWLLQTIDHLGREKNQGGDEMYITYSDGNLEEGSPPTAVAIIEDFGNGKYGLTFSTTPMNPTPRNLNGTERWKNSGSSNLSGSAFNVPEPTLKQFQPPSLPDFGQLPMVIFFGDSTLYQLVWNSDNKKFFRPNLFFARNIRSELNMEKIELVASMFRKQHKKKMVQYGQNVHIVLGSAAWDILTNDNIQGESFKDHLNSCRYLITRLREKYPGRRVFWKSPSALHMHRVNCTNAGYDYQNCLDSTRYLSQSRARELHYKQKSLMKELGVPYLDLFETYQLSAFYTVNDDGRHAKNDLNKMIINWFYPHNQTVV